MTYNGWYAIKPTQPTNQPVYYDTRIFLILLPKFVIMWTIILIWQFFFLWFRLEFKFCVIILLALAYLLIIV